MNERFEYKGYWYLPNNDENAIAGILTYLPNVSLELELIGAIDKSESDFVGFANQETRKIIWGTTSEGKRISLFNCIPSGGCLYHDVSFPISKYKIQFCLNGCHLEHFLENKFDWANVSISTLTYWYHPGVLKRKDIHDKESHELKQISVSLNIKKAKDPVCSVRVNDETIIDLKRDASFNSSNNSLNPCFSQNTIIRFNRSQKSNISEYLRLTSHFESFLSLASLKTIQVERILLYDDSDFQDVGDRKIFRPSELYFVQKARSLTKNKATDFLFSYGQIEDIYPVILNKWYNNDEKIVPIRQHLINSVKIREVFESIDFLIVIQAIEGFCSRFKKEQDLKQQLRDLLAEFDDVALITNLDINVDEVADSRHYYSHFFDKSKKKNIVDGIELYYLTRKLRVVLIACLLSYCGIENSRINKILNMTNNPLVKFD